MRDQIVWLAFGAASGSFFGYAASKGEPMVPVVIGAVGMVFGELGYLFVNFVHRRFQIDRDQSGSKIMVGALLGGILGVGVGPLLGLGEWLIRLRNPGILGGQLDQPLGVLCGLLLGAAIGGCVGSICAKLLKRNQILSDKHEGSVSEN